MTTNTEHFEKKLREELSNLEAELKTVGRINPENPKDWEVKGHGLDTDRAEEGEVADALEETENNTAVLNQLEARLIEVKSALEKVEQGKYGVCEVCGQEIEDDRLDANPAATTCKTHMN